MDTSQMRVTMCEKAEELQTLWKPGVGDWFYKRDGIGFGLWLICKIEGGILLCSGERMSQPPFNGQLVEFRVPEEYIWLPRQDQLQEMVEYENLYRLIGRFNAFCNPMKRMRRPPLIILEDDDNSEEAQEIRKQAHEEAIKILNPEEVAYPLQFTSMEQLWLAFVMSELYGKIWDGGDWIGVVKQRSGAER